MVNQDNGTKLNRSKTLSSSDDLRLILRILLRRLVFIFEGAIITYQRYPVSVYVFIIIKSYTKSNK